MENMSTLLVLIIISLSAVGLSVLWRTCIYTRGGIFRFVGRILDKWVTDACTPHAGIGKKILRFLAYPLGRCIYCSSFHLTYDIFFILNYKFQLGLDPSYLLILLPVTHLFVILAMNKLIQPNNDLHKSDWEYINKNQILDLKRRIPVDTILTPKEEDALEKCKSGLDYEPVKKRFNG